MYGCINEVEECSSLRTAFAPSQEPRGWYSPLHRPTPNIPVTSSSRHVLCLYVARLIFPLVFLIPKIDATRDRIYLLITPADVWDNDNACSICESPINTVWAFVVYPDMIVLVGCCCLSLFLFMRCISVILFQTQHDDYSMGYGLLQVSPFTIHVT